MREYKRLAREDTRKKSQRLIRERTMQLLEETRQLYGDGCATWQGQHMQHGTWETVRTPAKTDLLVCPCGSRSPVFIVKHAGAIG